MPLLCQFLLFAVTFQTPHTRLKQSKIMATPREHLHQHNVKQRRREDDRNSTDGGTGDDDGCSGDGGSCGKFVLMICHSLFVCFSISYLLFVVLLARLYISLFDIDFIRHQCQSILRYIQRYYMSILTMSCSMSSGFNMDIYS